MSITQTTKRPCKSKFKSLLSMSLSPLSSKNVVLMVRLFLRNLKRALIVYVHEYADTVSTATKSFATKAALD